MKIFLQWTTLRLNQYLMPPCRPQWTTVGHNSLVKLTVQFIIKLIPRSTGRAILKEFNLLCHGLPLPYQ